MLPIDYTLCVIASWLVLAVIGLALQGSPRAITRLVFPLGALGSLVLAVTAIGALSQTPTIAILPLGLPDLPFHLRLDALSAFFLLILGAASLGISLYSSGYFRATAGSTLGLLAFEYHLFLASMALVLLADDAYLFMVAWETMAISSYFLVTTDHKIPEIRSAGFIYLLVAHVGAIAILMCFGLLQGGHGDYTFASMRNHDLSPFWASAAFLLALFGFGAKAGMLPLHIWLPEAHPAAPSPVSAMMSGIMLKTAIYGILRISFDFLHTHQWWWGILALTLGLATALYGVLFATVQSDMKRLLAYSSIENIGILIAGIGLAILFHANHQDQVAALALVATLYHALNHSFFKSLLFLGTGSVLHATGERSMGKLGGLIRKMPWVALLALVGVLAISGLPPFNGFVSEWLLLQSFLLAPTMPQLYLTMLLPLGAAALVLGGALAAYAMVKFYGVIFLGQPREENLSEAHDAGPLERAGMLWLAGGCLILGLSPVFFILLIDNVALVLVGHDLGGTAASAGWLWLTPVSAARASYSPLILFLIILGGLLFAFLAVRKLYHGRVRRGPAWDCGYPAQTARMQDSAEGFGQPIRQIFDFFFGVIRQVPSPFDSKPHYHGETHDRLWDLAYLPIARLVEKLSNLIGKLQHGRIPLYLLYSFVTLIALLAFAR